MESSSYDVYEEHLKHLEEQLVTVTIENQNLALELQGYKDKESLSRLKTEIEIERSRFFKLEEKYKKLEKDYENQNVHSVDTAQGWVDVSLKSGKSKPVTNQSKVLGNKVLTNKADRIWKRAVQRVYTILDDFAEELEEEPETDEGPTLTVKQLKENINRFSADFKPYVDTVKGIQQMLAWKTPSYTLLMFMIFLISVWHGCLMSVILFCLVFRLTISLLNHLGFQINFNFFQPLAEPKSKEETNLGLSDKFNLVIQVARKVQNGLGAAADGLEKIQSLLTWRTPVTKKLYLMLFVGFVVSLFPAATADYSYIIGLSIGVKIFIVNYFYNRYPRLNRKYNSSYKTWQKLPTNAQYEKTCIKSEINQYVLSDSDKLPIKRQSSIKRAQIKEADKDFCQLFSLPNSESPLEGWQGGRRCSLINKDKSVLSAFKNGRLYLTRSFLCFERKKTPSKKNLVIPLGDIVDVSKVKPYSVLPGSGMALEVKVQGDKAFTFGAIVNRDDAYDSLILAGIEQNLSWATGPVTPNTTPTTPTSSLRRRGSSRISNFTWASDYVDTE